MRFPEIVVRWMIGIDSPDIADDSASGRHVSSAQRQRQDELAEVRCETGRAHVFGHPQQAMAELHGAAGRIETVAIIVVAGDLREYRFQVRVVGHRNFPLRDSQIRAAIMPILPSDHGWRAIQLSVSSPSVTSWSIGSNVPPDA